MPTLLAPAFVAIPPARIASAPLFAAPRVAAAAVPDEVAPAIPLPSPALSDGAYKTALSERMADPANRAGVYVSLATLISRDAAPPHVAQIVEVLTEYVDTTDSLGAVIPLKLLGRCGEAARPSLSRVLPLTSSSFPPVRAAVAEALGGMYHVSRGTESPAPPAVIATLVRFLRSDDDRSTKRAAAVALGRCQAATSEALIALAAVIGGSDVPVALGGLAAAEALGSPAKLLLPSIKTRLADDDSVANALPALFAVGSPQEAVDAMAYTLSKTTDFVVRQTLVYYAGQLKAGSTDTKALAEAIKPLMDAQISNNGEKASTEEVTGLRTSAASAYQTLSGDTATTVGALVALINNTKAPLSVRRNAVTQIGKMGKSAMDVNETLPALNVALTDRDSTLQAAAISVLFRFGGPAAQGVAPRLSDMLLTAWKNKEDSRVYSLMNAIYRIGPRAKVFALPVLKKIIAGEPKDSPNAQFAQLVLVKVSEQ